MYSKVFIALAIASAGAVSAQTGDIFHGIPISDTCKSAILAASSSPVAACLDIPGLYKVLALPEDVSWLEPISSWLNNACNQGDCDTAALTTTVKGVLNACQADLELIGYGGLIDHLDATTIPLYYKTGKNALCLRDQSNSNSLCVRDLALQLQKLYGVTYKPEDAGRDYTNVLYYGYGYWPSEIVCHKCTLGIYKEIKGLIPGAETIEPGWNAQCGANFTSKSTTELSITSPPLAQNNPGNEKNEASSLHARFLGLALTTGALLLNA